MSVIDASVAALLILPHEDDPIRATLNEAMRADPISVPHFRAEVTSLLLKAIRRGRVAPDDVNPLLAAAEQIVRRIDTTCEPPVAAVTTLAERFGLSAYDASYLWLAVDRGVPLLSLDGALRRAAVSLGLAA